MGKSGWLGLYLLVWSTAVLADPVTPRAVPVVTITTGGTAVSIVTGPISGGYVVNPPDAASQGIGTAENACIDPINAPVNATCYNTATVLVPGQPYYLPPLANGTTVKANALTSGHKLNVVIW